MSDRGTCVTSSYVIISLDILAFFHWYIYSDCYNSYMLKYGIYIFFGGHVEHDQHH